MGRVGRPKGLRGEVFVDAFNPDSDIFSHVSHIGLSQHEDGNPSYVAVERAVFNGKRWLLALERCKSLEDAQKLTHALVFVRRQDLPVLSGSSYYHVDLIGLKVVDQKGHVWGNVSQVYTVGHQDVIEIQDQESEKLYTCAWVTDFVMEVDISLAVIRLNSQGIVDAL